MKKTVVMKTLVGLLFGAIGLSQQILSAQATSGQTTAPPTQTQQATPAQDAQKTPRMAPGTVLPARLDKTVDAKKAKPGDEVVARITQDLKSNSGEVVIPKDTKIVGHVTEVQAHSKEQKESRVGIAFDHTVTKEGQSVSSPMVIQALIAPPNPANQTSQGSDSAAAAPTSGPPAGGTSGRSGQMGAGTQPAPNSAAGGEAPSASDANPTPAITAKTQGVIGISNYQLSTGADAHNGSIVTSEKNNVKLESGTFLLLRVNQ